MYRRTFHPELESYIKIDGTLFFVRPHEWSYTVMQYFDLYKISVPRFCYHPGLSIAGNCRMCMIEQVGVAKPLIACSTGLIKHASYFSNSVLVRKARENVLEFLLINHPLDCPICDQAGECDLQDQAYIFGSDRGRFEEQKRSVSNKFFGPFIKTIMTRCIHCTRCIRFMDEIAHESSLGMMGRGKNSEISLYAGVQVNSVLSGNLIDVCPVGAITAKPYANKLRPWELRTYQTRDILDSFLSSIRMDVKNNKIVRILPISNNDINDFWISDYVRFMYDSFSFNRLTTVLFKNKATNLFLPVSWSLAFKLVCQKISQKIDLQLGEHLDLFSVQAYDLLGSYMSKYPVTNILKSAQLDFLTTLVGFTADKLKAFSIFSFLDLTTLPVFESKILQFVKEPKLFFGSLFSNFSHFLHAGFSFFSYSNFLLGKHFYGFLLKNVFQLNYWSSASSLSFVKLPTKFQIKRNCVSISTSAVLSSYFGFSTSKSVQSDTLYSVNSSSYSVRQYPFSIYQSHHLSKTALNTDLIIPSLILYEQDFYFINILGWIQWSSKVLSGPLNVYSSFSIISQILQFFNMTLTLNKFVGFFMYVFYYVAYSFEYTILNLNNKTIFPFLCKRNMMYVQSIFVKSSRLLNRIKTTTRIQLF